MLDYWFILPIAFIISTAVSSIGIGGGVLWMPFFLIILKLPPDIAVSTSLIIQMAGMGSASIACIKQNRIDFKLLIVILGIAIPGVILGSLLSGILKPQTTRLLLGLLIMTTSLLFVLSEQKYNDLGNERVDIKTAYRQLWLAIPASIGSGMLSTSMSEWLIPMMRTRLSLKMSNAIGTCLALAFAVSCVGVLTHLMVGSKPHITVALWAIPGVILGGQIGSRLTKKINERLLKETFVFFLTLVGIHLVYNAF